MLKSSSTGRHTTNPAEPATSGGRPLSETEFETAIDSLEASTAAIEKQCRLLESQKKALQEIQARNATQDATTEKETRQKKLARERAQLDFDTDDLSQGTNGRLRTLSKQSDVATFGIPGSVERIFEKDDRLLDGLQKILPKFSGESENGDESSEVEQLCSALALLSAREVRARLDKVYRHSLAEYSRSQNGTAKEGLSDQKMKQRDTLRAELDELGSEIDGLVAIAVDHQYRKPLNRGLSSARADSQTQKARWSEYTVAALVYLTSRLDAINGHIHHVHSHSAALQSVSGTLEETLAVSNSMSSAQQRQGSPAADKSGGKGLKPLRLVQANLSEGQDPAISFLRQHDVRLADTDSAAKVVEKLDATARDQEQKCTALSKSTDANIIEALSGSLARSDTDLRELLGAVYAHSERSNIELVDPDVRAKMNELERETQRLGEDMRRLDVDDVARVIKAKQRQAIETLTAGRE